MSIVLIAAPWLMRIHNSISNVLAVFAICAFLCLGGFWLLNRYYRRRYGRAKDNLEVEHLRQFRFGTWLLAALLFVWLFFVIKGAQMSPVFFGLFLIPVGMLNEAAWSIIPLRRLYYTAASAISLLLLLPAMIRSFPGHQLFYLYDVAFLGILTLAASIFDHLLLVRAFEKSEPGL